MSVGVKRTLFALLTVVLFAFPPAGEAVTIHYFDCNSCHQQGGGLTGGLGNNNLCMACHESTAGDQNNLDNNPVAPVGRFEVDDASNIYNSAAPFGATPAVQTSHFWAKNTDSMPEAGAQPPGSAYDGNHGLSKGLVTCARCHDPHAEDNNPQQLKIGAGKADQMCLDCHVPWNINGVTARTEGTHPINMGSYNSIATANPSDFNASPVNVGNGDVRLVNGTLSCTTCHRAHYADSDATTVDGMANQTAVNTNGGDGKLLRSDGALRTGVTRNGAGGTAELRSNLCQACHKIELHGKGASGDHQIGCLDCHGGHTYNGGVPSHYALNMASPDAVPTRPDGVNGSSVIVNFPRFDSVLSTRDTWSDDVNGTANGFCEKCHGDVQAGTIVGKATEHAAGDTNECTVCHIHNDPANVHAFNVDASAATCGQCHGFPPYLNAPGDRETGGTDGGYAVNKVDPFGPVDYLNNSGHFKDESQTGHQVHAGADLVGNPGDWYFVGSSGIDNCKVCHGPNAGDAALGGHREDPATFPNTFRDVPFDGIAQTGGLTPAYDASGGSPSWTCSNVYCHSSGGPRTGDGPTRNYALTVTTPAWDVANGGGFGSIHGQTTPIHECAFCHGNDPTTMNSANRQNSAAHQAHLGQETTGLSFGCDVCHVQTAVNATTIYNSATDGRLGGKHINGAVDVDYKISGGTLYNALAVNSIGVNYEATGGTCANYCHDPLDDGNSVDWDAGNETVGTLKCDDCHGGLASDTNVDGGYGPIASGSHARHFSDPNGPQLACADCHGINSDAGTHASHVDGVVDIIPPVDGVNFANICEECHGYDADPGEVLPVWGNAGTTDCATCHTGTWCGTDINGKPVLTVDYARTTGHNRPTASGNYPESGNVAANGDCATCHITDSNLHWNGVTGDSFMLRTDDGFPATYAGNEDAFCANCHGVAPGSVNAASVATRNMNTHQAKLCVACHNVHGDQNVQMIWVTQADQLSHDPSVTGKYAADVFFTNLTNFTLGNTNSYDEDDGAVGGAGEANADDICATCHTVAAGTLHNNADNSTGDHYQGEDCFTCHAPHSDATDAFRTGTGTACNDCHGFPPATAAHRTGANLTDPELHSATASNDKDIEDRTDCAFCHTGADLYTYDLAADQGSGDPNRDNHGVSQTNRQNVLFNSVGYSSADGSCATACHASGSTDGFWTDANGLACDACHYYSATPSSAGNAGDLTLSHDEHFDSGKGCAECHPVENAGAPLAGPLPHITDKSGASDGAVIQGMAIALQDEAGVTRTSMTYDDVNNTCSGGIGLACHATGTPDWDVAIADDGTGCAACHTNTTDATVNPTSGLHDNSVLPITSGVPHDDAFTYNGGANNADCATCHTTAPSSAHFDGTLDVSTPTVVLAASVGFNDAVSPPTCTTGGLTGCHLEGTAWERKWDVSAYANDATRCANCHGTYTTGWVTGTIHAEAGNETRGSTHNNTGSSSYPCADCHVLGASTGNYTYTDDTNDWGGTSHHGDDLLQFNYNSTNYTEDNPTVGRVGCANGVGCHGVDSTHDFLKSSVYNLSPLGNLVGLVGQKPDVSCSGCHGGGTIGSGASNYWPDSSNANVENTAGEHAAHLTELAFAVYGEDVATLLTDNGNGTSDAKQKELCSYCHTNPGGDGDHGDTANLPAEVNTMYTMWSKTLDDGSYSSDQHGAVGNDTCSNVACHNEKPTTDNVDGWYDGSATACSICHSDITAEAAHNNHTGAATTFGRTITCNDCHQTGAENVAWGAPGTPPASGHINGTFTVTGSVAFTYTGTYTDYATSTAGSCGTNNCHENGAGGAPVTDPYNWGTSLADCSICHAATPATGAHVVHVNNVSYVPGSCNDCHTAGSNAAHINNSVSYAGKISAAPGDGSCTNTCHLSPQAGDWTGGTAAIACTDCHSSTYVGGDNTGTGGANYLPQYNMHLTVPTVSGVVHDDTAPGAGGDCAFCHDSLPAPGGSHVDGTWNLDSGTNTDRGMFAGFTDGTPATCTTTCHTAGTAWTYKWSATAANTDGTQCANCHGDYASGWNTGVGHTENPGRGNVTHTEVGTAGFPCTDCHSIGSGNGAYPYATTTNDWKPNEAGTTLHGDGFLNVNTSSTSWARNGTRSGCSACHEGATGTANAHDFPVSTFTAQGVAGDAPNVGGSCDSCHGGGGEYWPNTASVADAAYPDRVGMHVQHVSAIAIAAFGIDNTDNRNATCNYCHAPTTAPSTYEVGVHNDNVIPSADWDIRHILNQAYVDPDPVVNRTDNQHVTCSTVDCHFNNAVTPHWYTDDIAPAATTLSATTAGVTTPKAVKLTWNAPGDDTNVANTTPYVYDVRFGTTSAIASDFGRTDNYAGGLPAAYKQGYATEMLVENLTIGQNYYFAMRTRDTAGNWSTASNVVGPIQPTGDTVAPDFGGADKASKGDSGNTILLRWSPAEDHSMPMTYRIWMTAEGAGSGTGGALDMNVDTPIVTGWPDYKIQLVNGKDYGSGAITVTNDTIYNLGVRACDSLGNCDTNTQVVSATPTAAPEPDKTNHTYRTNGSTTLVKDGSAGTAVTAQSLPRVFAGPNLTYSVNYFVDTFAIYITGANAAASQVQVEMGFSTDGSNFTARQDNGETPAFITKIVDVPKKTGRVFSFKMVDLDGLTINANERLAVRVSEVTANGVTVAYGSSTYRGDLTLAEQIVNVVPSPATNIGTAMDATDTAVVNIDWGASFDDGDGLADTIHYDLYGSDDNSASFDYLIATDLEGTDSPYAWDAQAAGVPFGSTIAVRVVAGDGYGHSSPLDIIGLPMPAADGVRPGQITDLEATARPKSGSVQLKWCAPGDDGANHGRAAYYDIRYAATAISNDTDFGNATQVTHEPVPAFGGETQTYEVTGLTPGQTYYFAIKAVDEQGNTSPLSTAKSAGSDQEVGGPRCGMCHTTAPSVVESVGNHKLHGFTLADCDKCHDDGVNPPSAYGLDHQDGLLKMGYGPGGAHTAAYYDAVGERLYYTNNGQPMSAEGGSGDYILYEDNDNGWGGFGDGTYANVGTVPEDSGTCINFGALGVGGCHGSAGTDPDGAATRFPTIPTPTWDAAATLDCSACHGNPSRTTDTTYNRAFDGTNANGGIVPEQILGAPSVDNHGNWNDDGSGTEVQRKYIGQHEKHLNYSFRFSKGDSCNLCHAGEYADKANLDGKHANGEIDVQLDLNAAGPNAVWTPGTATTAGTCSNMSPDSCHPSASTPAWDTAQTFDCRQCHGMGGTTPSHVTDPANGVNSADNGWGTDPMPGNCTYCHFGGHPQDTVGGTSLILANSSQVGIDYRSGGIHLRKAIGGRPAAATEAELCWSCHDANGISEWGTDTGANNSSTAPPNGSNYNYGTVTTSNWTTATWSSGNANFGYKTGAIQSTHSTNETGTAAVTGTMGSYTESVDTVDKIRCSNCHDVHNLNKAPGDTMTGQPYLRGTWIRNPYPEDGAPWNKAYATVLAAFGPVPRAAGNEMGGYQIDQNNSNPTAGMSLASSAGLCTLCHGTNVDNMDKVADSGGLWIGTNGHSNSALGGTASAAANIFGHGIGGRPAPNAQSANETQETGDVFDMALQSMFYFGMTNRDYGTGYRSQQYSQGKIPQIYRTYGFDAYQWGATVDAGTTDVGYHAFTCSKCHNPHASRLPKLMITNCLDTRHSTWDTGANGANGQTLTYWTSPADVGELTSTWNTAQNCHRYDSTDNVGGWNKVTPW